MSTTIDILAELERVRDQFDWRFTPQTCTGGTGVRLRIRAVPRSDPTIVLDPLGVLCYLNYGKTFTPADWHKAAKLLDLQAPGVLVAAANDEIWAGLPGKREPVQHLQKVRNRLEEAVGLAYSQRLGTDQRGPSDSHPPWHRVNRV